MPKTSKKDFELFKPECMKRLPKSKKSPEVPFSDLFSSVSGVPGKYLQTENNRTAQEILESYMTRNRRRSPRNNQDIGECGV